MPQICICADDYALSSDISTGILELLVCGRISATSCMTNSPYWLEHGQQLKQLVTQLPSNTVEVGLHFNLTQSYPSYTPAEYKWSLSGLMRACWLNSISRNSIKLQLLSQWQQFEQVFNKQPDFIDGHQHIHQFPVIRQVLIEVLIEKQFKGWARSLNPIQYTPHNRFKCFALKHLGAVPLQQLYERHQVTTNAQFAGVYNFEQHTNYAHYMDGWFACAEHGLLVMCHPAQSSTVLSTSANEWEDNIAAARHAEFAYLKSDLFLQHCTEHQIEIKPVGAMDND